MCKRARLPTVIRCLTIRWSKRHNRRTESVREVSSAPSSQLASVGLWRTLRENRVDQRHKKCKKCLRSSKTRQPVARMLAVAKVVSTTQQRSPPTRRLPALAHSLQRRSRLEARSIQEIKTQTIECLPHRMGSARLRKADAPMLKRRIH